MKLIFMGMKQKNFFFQKKIEMGFLKKLSFSTPPILNIFSQIGSVQKEIQKILPSEIKGNVIECNIESNHRNT